MRIETKTELEMLQKRQRLTNLKNLRLDIARILQNLLTENKLTIAELAHITSWSQIYLQALINGQATPNIDKLNYLMLLFHKKIQLTLTD